MNISCEEHNSQILIKVAQGSEIRGYLVIDSTVGGRSCGGLRMLPDIDEKEMRVLARAMTLKYGFLGLPQGGAKAGVLGDPEAPQSDRHQRLAVFAKAIAPLLCNRIYIPNSDMGTNNNDIRSMLEAVGTQVKKRELRSTLSGYYTALTVFIAARQAMSHLNLSLSDCSVAIEGFGKVGSALANLIDNAQALIVAISTSRGAIYNPKGLDVRRLNQLATLHGSSVVNTYTDAEHINHEELLELPVDLLCPCARHDSVHIGNASRIKARVISPGANNPITREGEQILIEQGILCMPDFVTNSGGVLGGTMEFASVNKEQITKFLENYFTKRVSWLLDEAARKLASPREIAVPLALERFNKICSNAANPSLLDKLFSLGLEFHRRGWIPGSLVAPLSLPYFKRTLA
jgi:glutamate dehydrogenase (NAD(P)+)